MKTNFLNTIIIEDSFTQRKAISKLVNDHPDLFLLKALPSGIVALNSGLKKKADLILLDVEMPIINGFDFLESIDEHPHVIIISTKSDYALKAFEYNIVDYLQKPIDKTRFNKAIKRVVSLNLQFQTIKDNENFIYINSNLQKMKIYFKQIKWVEALGDYIKIVTPKGNFLVLSTMKAFLNQIPKTQFIRIHKSYIINVNKVDNWSCTKVEIDGIQIPISRTKKEVLEKILKAI